MKDGGWFSMIHSLLDLTRVLNVVPISGAQHEICAEAVANYYSGLGQLSVDLHAYLRCEKAEDMGSITMPSWLPQPEVVVEQVEVDEAYALAKDIFASWCRRVSACQPPQD